MKIEQYIILAIVGMATTIYKILDEKIEKIVPKTYVKKTILSLLVSCAVIPGVAEYYKLSFTVVVALVFVLNITVETVLKKLEKKVEEKIDKI